MARVTVSKDLLIVELQGLHQVWAFKRRIQVPLAHVRGATVDPGVVHEPKGLRAPGLHVPGTAVIGTFHRDGEKYFWDVRSGARTIVVQLSGETYTQLILEVDDPRATVDEINHALAEMAQHVSPQQRTEPAEQAGPPATSLRQEPARGRPHSLRAVWAFLALAYGWACLVGGTLRLAGIALDSVPGAVLVALLYMPAPAVAALVVERRVVRERLRLPVGRGPAGAVRFFVLPVVVVLAFSLLLAAATAVLEAVGTSGVGALVRDTAQLRAALVPLVGPEQAAAASLPESLSLVFFLALISAVVAGWSINGVLALGEEYGWRGLLWEQLRPYGVVPANLAIGVAWGLWHTPLILQGHNYPGRPVLGLGAMVAFTVAGSFLLTAIRELTNSVLPAAATHGAINGMATFLAVLVAGADPVVGGSVGVVSATCIGLLAVAAWTTANRTRRIRVTSSDRPPATTTAQPA